MKETSIDHISVVLADAVARSCISREDGLKVIEKFWMRFFRGFMVYYYEQPPFSRIKIDDKDYTEMLQITKERFIEQL